VHWIPAHRSIEDYIERDLSPAHYLGNMWADWFARRGADSHAPPKVYEEIYKAEIVFAKKVASYIGWAMQRALKVGKWEPDVSDAPSRLKEFKQPPVQVTTYVVAKLRDGSFVCRRCARRSSSVSREAWNFYLRAPCLANRVDELRAEAMIQFCGATGVQISAASAFAMGALDRAECEATGDGWESTPGLDRAAEPLVSEWHSADMHVCNGHRLRRAGPTVFCEVCVAWSGGGVSKQLMASCGGAPTGEAKGKTYLSNIKRALNSRCVRQSLTHSKQRLLDCLQVLRGMYPALIQGVVQAVKLGRRL
ncbi:unnamed protein product, partial [Prorocentrum cordatum]